MLAAVTGYESVCGCIALLLRALSPSANQLHCASSLGHILLFLVEEFAVKSACIAAVSSQSVLRHSDRPCIAPPSTV